MGNCSIKTCAMHPIFDSKLNDQNVKLNLQELKIDTLSKQVVRHKDSQDAINVEFDEGIKTNQEGNDFYKKILAGSIDDGTAKEGAMSMLQRHESDLKEVKEDIKVIKNTQIELATSSKEIREFIKKKKDSILLRIVGALSHLSTGMILIIVSFFVVFSFKYPNQAKACVKLLETISLAGV